MAPSFAQATSLGFTNPITLSNVSSDSQNPMILVSNDGVFVLWTENKNGRSDVFFTKSVDGGITFESPVNLSGSLQGQSGYAAFAQKDKDIYVVWQTSLSGTAGVFLARSLDRGTSFEKPINLSNNSGSSGWPQISVEGDNVYVNWVDSTPGRFDVFIAKSIDDGKIFEGSTNISTSKNESYESKMAILNNTIFVVWQEGSPAGGHTIVFSKSTTTVPEFTSFTLLIFLVSIIAIIGISLKSNLKLKIGF
jgi:hypothetical protein